MFLLTLSSLLDLSQDQQSGSDRCLDSETGTMMCIAGSTLHEKAMDAYQQCSDLADAGSGSGPGGPAMRSIFGSARTKRGVEERQTSDGQCPPVSEMGIAVNDTNPMYLEDSMTDCVLGAMDFIAQEGYPRHLHIKKALNTIIFPSVLENFSYGNNTKQRWDNCRNEMYGYKNYMMERATECGEAYTEDEAKAMKFYGARWDAFQCLTYELSNACENAFFTTAYTSAWSGLEYDSGSGDFFTAP